MSSPFPFKTTAEKPELTRALRPAECGPATPLPAPARGEDISATVTPFLGLHLGGGDLVITACLSSAHYMSSFLLLFVFLLTRKMHLKHNTGLLLIKTVIKGNPGVLRRKVTLSYGNCQHIKDT